MRAGPRPFPIQATATQTMTHIKTRKYAPRVSLLASATLAAGFAPLAAQAADGAASGTNKATDLDKVQVRGSWFNPDRKSTRLNSSHSQISYAVFCLKKKTQQLTTAHHEN